MTDRPLHSLGSVLDSVSTTGRGSAARDSAGARSTAGQRVVLITRDEDEDRVASDGRPTATRATSTTGSACAGSACAGSAAQ